MSDITPPGGEQSSSRNRRVYRPTTALDVFYQDDAARQLVGSLARDRSAIYFEYDDAWIRSGIELSPHLVPLQRGVFTSRSPRRLPGLFADSLPGDWGRRIVDSALRHIGIDPAVVSPVDRLAFLNDRTMGALTYEPPLALVPTAETSSDLSLLAAAAEELSTGGAEVSDSAAITLALDALRSAAGTAGGAQAKVLGGISPDTDSFTSGATPPVGYVPVIVKFTPTVDRLGIRSDAGALEEAYASMARAAGIEMPESRLLRTSDGRRHFAITRFDRTVSGGRRHVHTLGGLFNREAAENTDYSEFFAMARAITGDVRTLQQVFRRMYFNVAVLNDDDHSHNHAFMLVPTSAGHEWALAPAYDVTFSPNRDGVRGMSVGGSENPTWLEMVALARAENMAVNEITEAADRVDAALADWPRHAANAGVTANSVRELESAINERRLTIARTR